MKILSLLLSLCITLNTFAATGGLAELERQIDEYQYVMTVEWDQKDQSFYEKETDAFINRLGDVIQKEGLTKTQITDFAEKRIKNKKSLEALKLKMGLLSKQPSQEELAQTLRETSKEFYQTGASWTGNKAEIAGIVIVVLVLGYAVWFSATHECAAYATKDVCGWSDSCDRYTSYYDYEYGYWVEGCIGYSSSYSCREESYCTNYVKK